ncbi:hypothetical protein ACFOOM_07750, partial [Streptomyces echinoruber]|uniref:hypothetical protein n=1 Tax=Streptomyces echinoruber TaxID=68898 RepID=UPI003623C88B
MSTPELNTKAGKDIRRSSQLRVDGVHPAEESVFPHLPYADAVYTALAATGQTPEVLESGLRQSAQGVLFLRLVWPPGHTSLGRAVRGEGLSLVWSHHSGWSAHTACDSRVLDVDTLAAPRLLAHAARHLAAHGLRTRWGGPGGR